MGTLDWFVGWLSRRTALENRRNFSNLNFRGFIPFTMLYLCYYVDDVIYRIDLRELCKDLEQCDENDYLFNQIKTQSIECLRNKVSSVDPRA